MRARLNHFYTRYQLETLTGGNGQGRIESSLISTDEQDGGEEG